ncbi:MAG: hypothetical protein KF684_03045 [Phycisphaeraceae bacterium]|nr:hypothetical protein [Phycisphaeraceae bacterium]
MMSFGIVVGCALSFAAQATTNPADLADTPPARLKERDGSVVAASSQDRFATEEFSLAGISGPPRPFDLVGLSLEFIPVQGRGDAPFRYTIRRTEIDSLPIDPAGGTPVLEEFAIGNDTYIEVEFEPGGMSPPLFQFFGNAYSAVFIGSNGYVTFGQGDTSVPRFLPTHFSRARISALAADLDVRRGGSLEYLRLSDRFVVTWENVPRELMSDSSTFQIELHYTGKIVMSWVETSITDSIVGLSAGNGTPLTFVNTDLSSTQTGGFFPPVAESRLHRTITGTPIDFRLSATDDGHPIGVIVYRVTTLPAQGRLLDISANPPVEIEPGMLPYTMASGDLRFVPPNDEWNGRVEFRFVADDLGGFLSATNSPKATGGTSVPEASVGESGEAVIIIECGLRTRVLSYLVEDTLDQTGWTGFSPGGWEFGQPLGMGYNGQDPTSGYTGDNVIGFNLAGDYPDRMPATHLVSPPIDLTGVTGSRVSFRRRIGLSAGDTVEFAISTDGVAWTPLYSVSTLLIGEKQWRRREYDISKWADGEPTVYLRWTMGPSGIVGESYGWNIDDIVIEGMLPRPCCPGDVDGSGTVTMDDIAALLSQPFGPVEAPNVHDINGDGLIGVEDIQIISANLGIDCSGCD